MNHTAVTLKLKASKKYAKFVKISGEAHKTYFEKCLCLGQIPTEMSISHKNII